MQDKNYYVYIASNQWHSVIYTGVTNNIYRRMDEHRRKVVKGFTSKYNINKLLFIQEFSDVYEALNAEKKIKGWTREKKFKLIKDLNPELKDLWDSSPGTPVVEPSVHYGAGKSGVRMTKRALCHPE